MDKKESTILIDTDVVINFFDTNKTFYAVAVGAFDKFKKENTLTCISIVTAIEMLQGNKTSNDKKRIVQKLNSFYQFDISTDIGTLTKELILKYSASHGLMIADAFIAATALHFNIPLFTFNKKDFRFINNLELYEA